MRHVIGSTNLRWNFEIVHSTYVSGSEIPAIREDVDLDKFNRH